MFGAFSAVRVNSIKRTQTYRMAQAGWRRLVRPKQELVGDPTTKPPRRNKGGVAPVRDTPGNTETLVRGGRAAYGSPRPKGRPKGRFATSAPYTNKGAGPCARNIPRVFWHGAGSVSLLVRRPTALRTHRWANGSGNEHAARQGVLQKPQLRVRPVMHQDHTNTHTNGATLAKNAHFLNGSDGSCRASGKSWDRITLCSHTKRLPWK